MVYNVTCKSNTNPIISYLDECIHSEYDFDGELLLKNNNSVPITNNTRFKIINNEYIELTNPDDSGALVKISSIIGVVK